MLGPLALGGEKVLGDQPTLPNDAEYTDGKGADEETPFSVFMTEAVDGPDRAKPAQKGVDMQTALGGP